MCYDLNMCNSCLDTTSVNVEISVVDIYFDTLLSCGCVVRSCFGGPLVGG